MEQRKYYLFLHNGSRKSNDNRTGGLMVGLNEEEEKHNTKLHLGPFKSKNNNLSKFIP